MEIEPNRPDRLLDIVAAGPLIPGFEFTEDMKRRIQRIGQAVQTGREEFLDAMFGDFYFIPAPDALEVRVPARKNMARNYDKAADFDPSLAQQLDPSLIEQLSKTKTPVLLLTGELDHPEIQRRNVFLQATLPKARERTVHGDGHNIQLEASLDFVVAIDSFVAERCAEH